MIGVMIMLSQWQSAMFRTTVSVAGAAVLAGCATHPQEATIAARPSSLPVKNLTNFSESLRCMDRLFLSYGVEGVVLTSAGIPDETGSITAGTKEMLIAAISRMSRKSEAFTLFINVYVISEIVCTYIFKYLMLHIYY